MPTWKLAGLDIEGDGNSPIEPVETAVILPGRMHLAFLSNPGRPINSYATRVHGLTDADVAEAPPFGLHARLVQVALEGRVVVGHGIGGDLQVLERKIPTLSTAGRIDTLVLSRRCLGRKTNLRLHDLATELDVRPPAPPLAGRGAHSALFDAALGLALLRRLGELFPELVASHMRDSGLGQRR